MEKQCLDCGEPIVGRSDKKFCSDICRTNYNNSRSKGDLKYMRSVNSALKKNRKILRELNPEGKSKVSKRVLENKGFNFRFFTNVYKTKSAKVYYFCYEEGYLPIEGNMFALVRREENL